MTEQPPSVGRVVHYVAYGTPGGEFPAGICRAATITEVYNNSPITGEYREAVSVCVMNPTGLFFNQAVPYDPGKERCSCGEDLGHPVHVSLHPDSHDPVDVRIRYRPGTWHWPEFVAPRPGLEPVNA